MKAGFSKTALLVAAYRARASARPGPVCSDPWARAFAGEEGMALSENYDRVYPLGELYTGVRTAFIDGALEAALRSGAKQVLVLGAGMDARAARFQRGGVSFFEVDDPASHEEKLKRTRALPGYPSTAATYVACNFERDDFVERTIAAGLSTKEPTFIIWEGVVCYLSEPSVRATLRRIAEALHPASSVIFDYFSKAFVEGRSKRDNDLAMREWLDQVGEPLQFGINDVLPLLYEEGFRHVRSVSFDEACLSLTGTYDRERMFRFQHLATASVAPPSPSAH